MQEKLWKSIKKQCKMLGKGSTKMFFSPKIKIFKKQNDWVNQTVKTNQI